MSNEASNLVFIMWSGQISRSIADLVFDLISTCIPRCRVFYAPKIVPGVRWNDEVWNHLENSDIGIACITGENLYSHWMIYEMGSLAKRKISTLVPLLAGIDPKQLPSPTPIKLFQAVIFNNKFTDEAKAAFRGLLQAVDSAIPQSQKPELLKENEFDDWWNINNQLLLELANKSREIINNFEISIGKVGSTLDDEQISTHARDVWREFLQTIKNYIPSIAAIIESPRIINNRQNGNEEGGADSSAREQEEIGKEQDNNARPISTVAQLDSSTAPISKYEDRALMRTKRLKEIRESGGPSQSDWRTNPIAEEYAIMKEAEMDDVMYPLKTGDRVEIQRHVQDEYNGKTGIVKKVWRAPRHYEIEIVMNDGRPVVKAFHVMYLTKQSKCNNEADMEVGPKHAIDN